MFNIVTGEIFVSDQSDGASVAMASRLSANDDCEVTTESPFVAPAVTVPDVAFTSPLEVIARSDLISE
jgi:hypothetical protein